MHNDNKKLRLSDRGASLIHNYEGLRLTAYLCPSNKPTIGYGHTSTVTMDDVRRKKTITKEHAIHLFNLDKIRFENTVYALVDVPLNQNQIDALVSFTFNVGRGNFQRSTLLRLLNKGDYAAVPGQLKRWVFGAGRVQLGGLVRRRNDEAKLWEGIY